MTTLARKSQAPQLVNAMRRILSSLGGQFSVAFCFAAMWCALIESVNPHLWKWVKSRPWWPRACINQKQLLANFGYDKDSTTERMAVETFVWIITMCVTHIASAGMMLPVITRGWKKASPTGQLLFMLGTLCEVGFDLYDGPRLFCLSFLKEKFDWLSAPIPKQTFVLLGGMHHTTVVSLAIPMNLKYVHLPQYHWIAFSLLGSAGICYITGHYKFTVDSKTKDGLATCKRIVLIQVIANYLSRLFIYFPAAFYALKHFHKKGDRAFLYGGALGMLMMGIYNLAVIGDATATGKKWYFKSLEDKD